MVINIQHKILSKTMHVLPYLGNFIIADVRKLMLTLILPKTQTHPKTLTMQVYYGQIKCWPILILATKMYVCKRSVVQHVVWMLAHHGMLLNLVEQPK